MRGNSVSSNSLGELKQWQAATYCAQKAFRAVRCGRQATLPSKIVSQTYVAEGHRIVTQSCPDMVTALRERSITGGSIQRFFSEIEVKELSLLRATSCDLHFNEYVDDVVRREAWVELDMLREFCGMSQTHFEPSLVSRGIEDNLNVLKSQKNWHVMWALWRAYFILNNEAAKAWASDFYSELRATIERLKTENPEIFPETFNGDRHVEDSFMRLVAEGHAALVRAFLEAGMNPDIGMKITGSQDYDDTPLHSAAEAGHAAVVRVLLEFGADVHRRGSCYNTALHCAAGKGKIEVAGALLGAGADIHSKQFASEVTPLLEAVFSGSIAMVAFLLGDGADITDRNVNSKTALHIAVERNDVAMIKELILRGAEIEAQDNEGKTPLHRAVLEGHVGALNVLLEEGADLNAKDIHDRTVLHCAAMNGHIDMVALLLLKGLSVDARDKYGQTVLHYAAMNGHVEVMELLLEHGADPSARNIIDATILDSLPWHFSPSSDREAEVRAVLEEWIEGAAIYEFFETMEM